MITAPGLMFSLSNVYENNHIGEKEAKQQLCELLLTRAQLQLR